MQSGGDVSRRSILSSSRRDELDSKEEPRMKRQQRRRKRRRRHRRIYQRRQNMRREANRGRGARRKKMRRLTRTIKYIAWLTGWWYVSNYGWPSLDLRYRKLLWWFREDNEAEFMRRRGVVALGFVGREKRRSSATPSLEVTVRRAGRRGKRARRRRRNHKRRP